MSLLAQIVSPLVPVAMVIGLGYLAGCLRLARQDSVLITRLVLDWIFPPMLLAGMATTPRGQLLDGRFIGCALLSMMGMYLLVLLAGYRCGDRRVAALRAFVCAFPDAAFMGIPILAAMFGPSSLYAVLVVNLVSSLVMIPLTTLLLEEPGRHGHRTAVFVETLTAALKRPLVWAPLLGIVLSLTGTVLPKPVYSGLTLIGCATSGVSLFCLGLIISGVVLRLTREVWLVIALKNLLHPLVTIGLLLGLGLHGTSARELLLLSALPSATMTAMFANEARAYEAEASGAILLGTLLSLITFPLVIWLSAGLL